MGTTRHRHSYLPAMVTQRSLARMAGRMQRQAPLLPCSCRTSSANAGRLARSFGQASSSVARTATPHLPHKTSLARLSWRSHSHLQRLSYSTTAPNVSHCPTCSAEIAPATSSSPSPITAQCPSCNAFLPPLASIDYFELFGLPKQFLIDGAQLKRSFLQWQGKVHPDRLQTSSDSAKQEDWAKTWSALVNEGYKTLSNESRRGEYMLLQRGVQIEEQDKMEDPELLMEILEVREALEEASTEEEVGAIRDQNKHQTEETLRSLQACLEEGDIDIQRSKALLMRLRYQDNVENVCKDWQPGKEIVLQH